VPERQKIKNDGLVQYGTEGFGRLIFATIRKSVGLKGLKYQTRVIPVGDAGDAAVEVFRTVKQLLTQNIHVGSASSHVVWNHRHEVLCRAEIYTPAALHRSAPKLHTKINSYLVQNCEDIRKRACQQPPIMFRLTL